MKYMVLELLGIWRLFQRYFTFGRAPRNQFAGIAARAPTVETPPGEFPLLGVAAQFVAIAAGIFAQPLAAQARHNGGDTINFHFLTTGWFVASLVLAIIVFPGAYRPQAPSSQPRLVQFCVLFAAGIGWQATFDSLIR